MKVLVTGASGFVGGAVLQRLAGTAHDGLGAVRNVNSGVRSQATLISIGDIHARTDWRRALEGIDCVIHCAAKVHVLASRGSKTSQEFHEVNVAGTRRLAEQASAANVRRIVFVSSVKVNGESTGSGGPFSTYDQPSPCDVYGLSKFEAEQALREVEDRTGLEVVVVRPPLVYGPGVRANFQRLVQIVDRGWPLPFGAVHNQRSLVSLDNLVDLLIKCIDCPAAAANTFLVSDGCDLSTPELIKAIGSALGGDARLFPVPVSLLRLVGRMTGKSLEVERLVGSLQVDIQYTRDTLDWTPPVQLHEALARTVAAYRLARS